MTLEQSTVRAPAARSLFSIALAAGMALSLLVATPVSAADADLLEQAIYTEETVGDLDAAAALYEQIIDAADARRPVVARALFRLGVCREKAGELDAARAAFARLLDDDFDQDSADHAELVARAQERLASLESALPLRPAPWSDGEFLRYRMSLPTGRVIGTLDLHAESAIADGREVWRLEVRRFVLTHADNYGVSRIWVDAVDQRPIRSSIRHGVLGAADAVFGPDGVRITGIGDEIVVTTPTLLYDNDQSMYLMRLLPLAPGYEARLPLLPIWTGAPLEADLEVETTTTCRVPAGTFECHRVQLDHGETHWYSTGPEQLPLKVKAGGIQIELVRVGTLDSAAPVPFKVDGFDIAGTLPAGWLPYQVAPSGREGSALVRMLDPSAAAISGLEVDRCPRRGCPSLDEVVARERAGAEQRFEDYAVRPETLRDRTVDGRRIVSFAGDYLRDDEPWVQSRHYLFVGDVRLEVIFRTPAETFDARRADFDAIVESLHGA